MGIGIAFAVDALTYIFSILTLWAMSYRDEPERQGMRDASLAAELGTSIRCAWSDVHVRLLMLTTIVISLLYVGPMMAGIPVLASQRLPEGAAALGIILSLWPFRAHC